MRLHDYPDTAGLASPSPACSDAPPPAFSAEHLQEGRLLLSMGFARPMIARAMTRARARGNSVHTELLASGEVVEATVFEALARDLGLPFWPTIDPRCVFDHPALDSQLRRPEMLRLHYSDRPPITIIAPTLESLAPIKAMLARRPGLAAMMAVSTPRMLRQAAWEAGRARRMDAAVNTLFERTPELSARLLWRGWQGFVLGILLSTMLVAAVLTPLLWMLALHLLLTGVYFVQFALRLAAFAQRRSGGGPAPAPSCATDAVPVYSILVALKDEAAMVPQLVRALDRLDWPRSRLDIKFVCEADDALTLAALTARHLAPEYEIVRVPPGTPRTKPKALQYALPGVRGEYVTVFDAEDRPHPGQLRAAHAAFLRLPAQVACLQAPLIIGNAHQSRLSALFAIDYAGHFRAVLPLLARLRMPIPLGGTSNHIKTALLRQAGGWDPFNVTEDADLGIRFYRMGYRTAMIELPTLEDAPTERRVWLGQRTRWYKGWLQTYLVMMRRPGRLLLEMGLPAFLLAQVMIGGMLLSALGHPVILGFLAFLAIALATGIGLFNDSLAATLLVVDLLNIAGSYAITVGIGLGSMTPMEKRAVGRKWLAIPLYWLMISFAAWSAILDLYRRPTLWTKTPHRPTGDHPPG